MFLRVFTIVVEFSIGETVWFSFIWFNAAFSAAILS